MDSHAVIETLPVTGDERAALMEIANRAFEKVVNWIERENESLTRKLLGLVIDLLRNREIHCQVGITSLHRRRRQSHAKDARIAAIGDRSDEDATQAKETRVSERLCHIASEPIRTRHATRSYQRRNQSPPAPACCP